MKLNTTEEDKEYLMRLGLNIKKYRLAENISQSELARRCGYEKSNYNTIENGNRNLSVLNLRTIARALRISVATLIDF